MSQQLFAWWPALGAHLLCPLRSHPDPKACPLFGLLSSSSSVGSIWCLMFLRADVCTKYHEVVSLWKHKKDKQDESQIAMLNTFSCVIKRDSVSSFFHFFPVASTSAFPLKHNQKKKKKNCMQWLIHKGKEFNLKWNFPTEIEHLWGDFWHFMFKVIADKKLQY